MLPALAMASHAAVAKRGDGRLWAAALGLSLFCNGALLLLAGLAVIHSEQFQHPAAVAAAPAESVRFIAPEPAAPLPNPDTATQADPVTSATPITPATAAVAEPAVESAASAPTPGHAPGFARTSDDQRGKRPDKPAFIGERNTDATSEATPDPNAPAMPAQAGIQPRHAQDFETTESRYQDGALTDASARTPEPPDAPDSSTPRPPETPPAPPESAARGVAATTPGRDEEQSIPPPSGRLAEGSNPVEIPVPLTTSEKTPKSAPRALPREGTPDALPSPDDLKETKTAPTPQETPKQAAFHGNQRKTAIQGSISRSGRSALDVEDSPLGRYQATLSRAIELEWLRICVRYRDFISLGVLTVRFFVVAKGKVRNVQFVGALQTGLQQ